MGTLPWILWLTKNVPWSHDNVHLHGNGLTQDVFCMGGQNQANSAGNTVTAPPLTAWGPWACVRVLGEVPEALGYSRNCGHYRMMHFIFIQMALEGHLTDHEINIGLFSVILLRMTNSRVRLMMQRAWGRRKDCPTGSKNRKISSQMDAREASRKNPILVFRAMRVIQKWQNVLKDGTFPPLPIATHLSQILPEMVLSVPCSCI